MIGGAAAVLLAVGACPNTIETYAGYGYCYHEGYTFDSDDDRVCSATTDGFDCCYWLNSTGAQSEFGEQFYSRCFEDNTHTGLPCDNSLAETQVDSGIVHSRNCSDHNHSALPTTTTPPAQPADDSGLSTGAVAGISVGAVAFVGLIAAAAVCF